MEDHTPSLTTQKRIFSRIGFAFCTVSAIATVLQLLWLHLPTLFLGENNWFTQSGTGFWLGTFLPIYLVAIPAGLLILKKLPSQAPEQHNLRTREFLILLPMAFCLMYGGNLLGTFLSMILSGIVQAFAGMEIGGIIIIVGFMVGLSLIVYAQFKYNKGIF